MAYDPNDAADKAIVQGLIEEAIAENNAEHEVTTSGLVAKNKELLVKLNKARKSDGGADTEEISRLEHDLETTQERLRTIESENREANRTLKALGKELETAKTTLGAETAFGRKLLVENGLTEALVQANVAPQFMPAARALLEKQVQVKADGDDRKAVVGDKSLGDFVTEWSQSDQGKVFIAAPTNGGGGTTPPGSPPSGSKKIYEMNDAERVAAFNANPTDFNTRVAAGENKKP
jgi:chromosome segregation ATPase